MFVYILLAIKSLMDIYFSRKFALKKTSDFVLLGTSLFITEPVNISLKIPYLFGSIVIIVFLDISFMLYGVFCNITVSMFFIDRCHPYLVQCLIAFNSFSYFNAVPVTCLTSRYSFSLQSDIL